MKVCLVQEPKQFNDFLLYLCGFCMQKDLASFCEFLASKDVTLITKFEAVDRYDLIRISSNFQFH